MERSDSSFEKDLAVAQKVSSKRSKWGCIGDTREGTRWSRQGAVGIEGESSRDAGGEDVEITWCSEGSRDSKEDLY